MNSQMQEIRKILTSLGITANYAGFNYMTYAIYLTLNDPVRLHYVTKLIYPDVARMYKTGAKCVERSIRTACNICWERNPHLICTMAGYQLTKKPSNSVLLAIVSTWISSDKAGAI